MASPGIGFLETLKNPANLFKKDLNNMRNNTKSQIKKKEWWNCMIPTFFLKKASHEGTKSYGEVVLNWRTNDQIMPRFERNFVINDKYIF